MDKVRKALISNSLIFAKVGEPLPSLNDFQVRRFIQWVIPYLVYMAL